jgi:hypothetical protein
VAELLRLARVQEVLVEAFGVGVSWRAGVAERGAPPLPKACFLVVLALLHDELLGWGGAALGSYWDLVVLRTLAVLAAGCGC